MDWLRGRFSGQDDPDNMSPDDVDTAAPPRSPLGSGDERRMQVRAYNFWASLLGDRTFPDIASLHPDDIADFGPHSVLLDFRRGLEDPAIAYLGAALAQECGVERDIARLAQVPPRSLLTRITDHYLQIIANQAPIGFEAEFVNQRGNTVLYRGILLPFSDDGATIDHIYGVINWKELADQLSTDTLMQRLDESVEAPARDPQEGALEAPLTEWADGPTDFAASSLGAPMSRALELPEPGFLSAEPLLLDVPLADDAVERIDTGGHPGFALADWLASARELAQAALAHEERSHRALYAAIGRAYDFALAAQNAPEDYATLIEDAGLKAQERAPMIPLLKLVFGLDYDKTRLAEFATAIAHGRRLALVSGALAQHLCDTPGGLKAVVRDERRLRRADAGSGDPAGDRRARIASDLRTLEARPLTDVAGRGEEFTMLVARRLENGEVVLLGEVEDEALLVRAARHLLG